MNEELITISRKQYESLLEDSIFLSYLETCGVDNWSGYDYACDMFNQEKENK